MNKGLFALAVLLAAPGCSANAEGPPRSDDALHLAAAIPERPNGPVLDQAGILPDSVEADLDQRLRRLWNDTGDALVVVTVNSLEGRTVEEYAFDLFNIWGIGDRETRRGLLILVAPNERRVRIEIGCGLESRLSDAYAAEIIDGRMLPQFREGDFAGGVDAAVDDLTAELARPQPANDPGPRSPLCRGEVQEAA